MHRLATVHTSARKNNIPLSHATFIPSGVNKWENRAPTRTNSAIAHQ